MAVDIAVVILIASILTLFLGLLFTVIKSLVTYEKERRKNKE